MVSVAKYEPARDIPDLAGMVYFITGGTAGLGSESVLALAAHNPAHIFFSGRNASAATALIDQVGVEVPSMASRVTFIQCDLASTASVREAANFFLESFGDKKPRLDVLMCNAGIMLAPPAVTVDGYEIHFGTNHVGHAFLIKLLLPTLRATANGPGAGNARIILNSSLAAELAPRCGIDFDAVRSRGEGMGHIPIPAGWARYGQSKLANMLYARALARKEPEITTVSVHPGVIKTGLVTSVSFANRMLIYASNPFSILTPEQGVKNQLWAATVDKTTLTPGEYYTPVGVTGAQTAAGKAGKNDDLADKLWDWTQKELAKL